MLAGLRKALPRADLVYVSDREGAPYGSKSAEWVRERVRLLVNRAACDVTVLACNTATAASAQALRAEGQTVYGIAPAVRRAQRDGGEFCVLCTPLTARLRYGDGRVRTVCHPWLATEIEKSVLGKGARLDEIADRIAPSLAPAVVIGCTHYAFLSPCLRARGFAVYDGAEDVCRRVASRVLDEGQGRMEWLGEDYSALLGKIEDGKFGTW